MSRCEIRLINGIEEVEYRSELDILIDSLESIINLKRSRNHSKQCEACFGFGSDRQCPFGESEPSEITDQFLVENIQQAIDDYKNKKG